MRRLRLASAFLTHSRSDIGVSHRWAFSSTATLFCPGSTTPGVGDDFNVAPVITTRRTRRKTIRDEDEDDIVGSVVTPTTEQTPLVTAMHKTAEHPETAPAEEGEDDAAAPTTAADTTDTQATTNNGDSMAELRGLVENSPYSRDPLDDVIEAAMTYNRATTNPNLINPDIEDALFPILLVRFDEFTITPLLDLVETPWCHSCNVRYGRTLKDMVRDRIATNPSALTSPEVLRAFITMGMSAGRRKRDLAFFQLLGTMFVQHVNSYKDPNDIVRVLTACARAKIVPPDSFLALCGRRLPVLSKKQPLRPLACYCAFVNMQKFGHENLNPFRFLADRVFEGISAHLKAELVAYRKQLARDQEQQPQEEEPAASSPAKQQPNNNVSPNAESDAADARQTTDDATTAQAGRSTEEATKRRADQDDQEEEEDDDADTERVEPGAPLFRAIGKANNVSAPSSSADRAPEQLHC